MSKAKTEIPTDKIALYERLLATNPQVECKGAASRYTSVNGHMFSFMTKTGQLALRLPATERDEFLKKHKTKLCVQHGTVMKEYAEVPDALLKKTEAIRPFFELSFAYVSSLKPKPTRKATKKKPTSKKPTSKKPIKKKAPKKKAIPKQGLKKKPAAKKAAK